MKLLLIFFTIFFSLHSMAIEFTQEEKEYIASKKVIKVHNEQLWSPFNFNEKVFPKDFLLTL